MLGRLGAPVRELKGFRVSPRGRRRRGGIAYLLIDKLSNMVHNKEDVEDKDVRARSRAAGAYMGPPREAGPGEKGSIRGAR